MFKPKYNQKNQRLSFKVDAGIVNNRESDLLTGRKNKDLEELSLFIDDATLGASSSDSWIEKVVISMLKIPQWSNLDLVGADLTDADLTGAGLGDAILSSAIYDPTTIWPTADFWYNTTCPDGTNSNDPGNATCGL